MKMCEEKVDVLGWKKSYDIIPCSNKVTYNTEKLSVLIIFY